VPAVLEYFDPLDVPGANIELRVAVVGDVGLIEVHTHERCGAVAVPMPRMK